MTTSDPIANFIAMRDAAIANGADYCEICGQVNGWKHDHKPDQSGPDDPICHLPGCEPRKKMVPKSADETREIRARAWATRRAKYGTHGHR